MSDAESIFKWLFDLVPNHRLTTILYVSVPLSHV